MLRTNIQRILYPNSYTECGQIFQPVGPKSSIDAYRQIKTLYSCFFLQGILEVLYQFLTTLLSLYSSGCKLPNLDNPDKRTDTSCDNEPRIMTRYPMRDELFEQHPGYHIVLTIGREQHQMYSNVIRTFEFGQYTDKVQI